MRLRLRTSTKSHSLVQLSFTVQLSGYIPKKCEMWNVKNEYPKNFTLHPSPFWHNNQICLQFPGDYGGGETPVPIPNTAVKTSSADGTALETVWKSKSLPGIFIFNLPKKQKNTLCIHVLENKGLYFCNIFLLRFLILPRHKTPTWLLFPCRVQTLPNYNLRQRRNDW